VVGRPFPKGVSGNPGGRPKGLVRRIREQTDEGAELVDYMLGVFRNESESTRTRVEAASWLADRGFGKPQQTSLIASVDAAQQQPELTREERLARYLELCAKLDASLAESCQLTFAPCEK
jgi:Family of unknown function (DUF5681)